jgi:hypothetical protein
VIRQLAILLVVPFALSAQSPCRTTHLTVFDANLGPMSGRSMPRQETASRSPARTLTDSNHPHKKLGDRMMEFELSVPANGSVSLVYTVESR